MQYIKSDRAFCIAQRPSTLNSIDWNATSNSTSLFNWCMFRTMNSEDGLQKIINFTKQTCVIHYKTWNLSCFACFVSDEMRVNGGASSSSDVSCSIGSCLVYVSAQTLVTLTDILRYFSAFSGQILSLLLRLEKTDFLPRPLQSFV
jgi:hypothetical protein